jgi:ArsR family transcriptional regulator
MSMVADVDVQAPSLLKVLAEPVRWRIVELLAEEELCVCHLVEALELAQPLVSHHLRVLRDAQLVETSRYRYWTYYRLRPEVLDEAASGITALAAAVPPAGRRRRPCC